MLICGTLTTKDTAGFLAHFKGLAREVIAVPIAGEHAARTAEEVAAIARARRPPADAGRERRRGAGRARRARLAESPPRILIAGSLYLAGAVLEANGNLPR